MISLVHEAVLKRLMVHYDANPNPKNPVTSADRQLIEMCYKRTLDDLSKAGYTVVPQTGDE